MTAEHMHHRCDRTGHDTTAHQSINHPDFFSLPSRLRAKDQSALIVLFIISEYLK